MTPPRVGDALRKGLVYISSAQQPDGSFYSFSSPTESPFQPRMSYQTVFGPASILYALSGIHNPASSKIRRKLAQWLVDQRGPHWSFNYWAKSAPEYTKLPYPDDLDDTFCALSALYEHDLTIIDEACLGKVVKLLIAAEQQVGGPYRTWLADKNAPAEWQDVDLAVNSNVACFLRMVAEPPPNLTALMDGAIESRIFKSPYYPNQYPLLYFLARAYKGSQDSRLIGHVHSLRRNGWWGSPLKTSLALLALAQLGESGSDGEAIQHLIRSQNPDGSWPAEAFCLDPAVKGHAYYSGSEALSTAFALSALAASKNTTTPTPAGVTPGQPTALEYNQVKSAAFKEINALRQDLKNQGIAMLERMTKNDNNQEIVLLPRFFNDSLHQPLDSKTDERLARLGLANLYGWTAYTIFDDFLDNEGQPAQLSLATVCLRYSIKHFRLALPSHAGFHKLVDQTFDDIDGANAWELANCRMKITPTSITIGALPQYEKTLSLADRSLGHTLTPLGVLAAAGIEPDNPRAILVRRSLRHYIVSRQLNDDLHDWEQDLQAGVVSYVVTAILRELALPPGRYTFASLVPKMQRQFWHHTLGEVCKIITTHTTLARRTAESSRLLRNHNIIGVLTTKIDESVTETIQEQAKAEQFLAAYKSKDKLP